MFNRKSNGILNELAGLRTSFGPEFNQIKLNLPGSIAKQKQLTIKQLMNYHKLLLFMMAYPYSLEIYQTAANYFSKWIECAKTVSTKEKRLTQTIDAL